MSLWKIAWRSIQQRSLASSLTALSMALGVALVVTVLVIHHVVDQSFRRSAQGYNLIVGPAKGSGLELVLSTVYHLSQPVENVPYTFYLEFTRGRFAADVEAAIPVCIGDNYQGFHVVGTLPEMFTKLRYLNDRPYEFAAGRNLDPEHRHEAVVGAFVAEKTGLKLGSQFRPAHGLDQQGGHEHEAFTVVGLLARTGTPADRALYVNMEDIYCLEGHVGSRLQPAAAQKPDNKPAAPHAAGHAPDPPAAVDHDHAKDDAKAAHDDHDHDHAQQDAQDAHAEHGHDHAGHGHHQHHIPDEAKEITAILVAAKPWKVMALASQINRGTTARAVLPVQEISRLFDGVVGNVQVLLLILAVLVVVVAGIGMLVSIYNSMQDRRHEIAVMRALGARRYTVMSIIFMESALLSLGGGLAGLALGHALIGLLAPLILQQTGVLVEAFSFQWNELLLIPGLLALSALIGYLPALVAYRTDVARSLTANQ